MAKYRHRIFEMYEFRDEAIRALTRKSDQPVVRDSKVLCDFAGVMSFSSASLDALALFNRKLRIKGSRMVLCSLDPTARECFFVDLGMA